MVFHGFLRFALEHHVAAKLARDHDQRTIQHPAFLEIEHELRDGRVDHLLHADEPRVSVLMRVPIQKGNILRRHFDETRPRFAKSPRKQTAQTKSPDHTLLVFGAEAIAGRVEAHAGLKGWKIFSRALQRLKREIERLRRRRTEQAVRVVHRAQERIFLIAAAFASDRTSGEQFAVKFFPISKTAGAHSRRRPHRIRRLLRKSDVERTVLAPEKSRRRERLQLFAFTEIETLADVNKRRHRRIERPERAGHPRADVRRRDRLRRHVARVPIKLVPRVQNKSEVRRLHAADQRPAIHHVREMFQPCRETHTIDVRRNRGKRAQNFIRVESGRVRRVALRIKGLRVRHPAAHPEHDHAIGGRRNFFQFPRGEERTRRTGREGRERSG